MHIEEENGVKFECWTPEEVLSALEAGEIALIDVRTPQEYAFEHVEGGLLSPLAEFKPAFLPSQQGKRLVFHCGSGMRSRKVLEACIAAGVTPLAHMAGGFAAWKTAGLPYIGTDPATGGIRHVARAV
ncbi:MAG: rhodanese-like domain-containing protein [Zavarzinia sp.]|nr:rhodanese-like domain-containing protein [Zavarzinia sp.]